MSLFNQTARYLLLTALAITIVGSIGFYVLIHRTIQREVDEILTSQVEQAVKRLKQHPSATLVRPDGDDNPHIERLSGPANVALGFVDTETPDPLDSTQNVPIRQLRSVVELNEQAYLIVVSQPYFEFDELARIMSVGVILGFLLLMAISVVVGLGLSQRLWKPFYAIINQLRTFQLDSNVAPVFTTSHIREFTLLGQSLQELTDKLRQQFSLQKQFTQNASHELQTPLAVASAELDFLFQSKQLTETDHVHLQRATDALTRLSQLNRSLLLLTQVENDLFITDDQLDLSTMVRQYVGEYEPFFQYKEMDVTQLITPNVTLRMNRQLASVMVANLLKNASRHGTSNGLVRIELAPNILTVANTGEPLPFADDQLFNRFVKDPARPDSTGLGLALVKQICDRYGFKLTYQYAVQQRMHIFQIQFS